MVLKALSDRGTVSVPNLWAENNVYCHFRTSRQGPSAGGQLLFDLKERILKTGQKYNMFNLYNMLKLT